LTAGCNDLTAYARRCGATAGATAPIDELTTTQRRLTGASNHLTADWHDDAPQSRELTDARHRNADAPHDETVSA